MGRNISLKPIKLSEITVLLMPFEVFISFLPGFLDHLNFDFSINKTFVLLDFLFYGTKSIFWPRASEEHSPSYARLVSIRCQYPKHPERNTCPPEEPHCLIMEFDDFCIEKA